MKTLWKLIQGHILNEIIKIIHSNLKKPFIRTV